MIKHLTIGKLAKQTGVNTITIRYYEQCGLIPKATRSPAGYRLYPDSIIGHIEFLKHTKTAGFSLAEIGELVELLTSGRAKPEEIKAHLAVKTAAIKEKIIALDNVQKLLEQFAVAPELVNLHPATSGASDLKVQSGNPKRRTLPFTALADAH